MDDYKILEAIFNPEHPSSDLQLPDSTTESDCDDGIPNLSELKTLETAAVKLAEGDNLLEALDLLNQVINRSPNYASGYNNRAQVISINIDTLCIQSGLNIIQYFDLRQIVTVLYL